jgi:ferredoxin
VRRTPLSAQELVEQVREELHACIGCNECLLACPALGEPISAVQLNTETLRGPISVPVAQFARSCMLCGACTEPGVCPAGLHRDTMMLFLKVRLLRAGREEVVACPTAEASDTHPTAHIA